MRKIIDMPDFIFINFLLLQIFNNKFKKVTIFFVSNYYLIRLTNQLNNYFSFLNKMNTKQIIIMNVIRKNIILGTFGKTFE